MKQERLARFMERQAGISEGRLAAKVGSGGRVCIYTSGQTHIIADIFGYFPDTLLSGL